MTEGGVESDEMVIYRWRKEQRSVKKVIMMSSKKTL
jgi:hypothetical protein